MDYSIPQDWIAEAGLDGFMPATQGYRCDEPHSLVALTDIAPIKRDRPLDRNGFVRDRMMAVLLCISYVRILSRPGGYHRPLLASRIDDAIPTGGQSTSPEIQQRRNKILHVVFAVMQ